MPSSSSHMFPLPHPTLPTRHPPQFWNLPLSLVQGKEEVSGKRGEGEGVEVVFFSILVCQFPLKKKKNSYSSAYPWDPSRSLTFLTRNQKENSPRSSPPCAPLILADASPSPLHPTRTHSRTHPSGGVPPDGVPIRVGVAGTVPWPVVPIRVGAVVTTTPMRPPSSLGWTPCLPSPGRISTEEERRCWEPRCPPATGEANKVLNQKKKTNQTIN